MGLSLGSGCTCVPLTVSSLDWTDWDKVDCTVCVRFSVFWGLHGFFISCRDTSDSSQAGTVLLEGCVIKLFGSLREKGRMLSWDCTMLVVLSREKKRIKTWCRTYYKMNSTKTERTDNHCYELFTASRLNVSNSFSIGINVFLSDTSGSFPHIPKPDRAHRLLLFSKWHKWNSKHFLLIISAFWFHCYSEFQSAEKSVRVKSKRVVTLRNVFPIIKRQQSITLTSTSTRLIYTFIFKSQGILNCFRSVA